MPRGLLRRAAAWAIDAVPTLTAVLLTTLPVFLLARALAAEQRAGFAVFDPIAGGDPLLRLLPTQPVGAVAAACWFALQAAALVMRRRSLGKWLLGLRPLARDGQPPSRTRAFLRESPRAALLAALVLVGALGPHWLRTDPATFYAPTSLTGGPAPYPPVAALITVLALMLAALTVADLVLVLASPSRRSLADRLGGTVVS
jgi:uncharacterized protein (TIGR03382 family)